MSSPAYDHLQSLREAWSKQFGPIINQRRSAFLMDEIVIVFQRGRAIVRLKSGDQRWQIVEEPKAPAPINLENLPAPMRNALGGQP